MKMNRLPKQATRSGLPASGHPSPACRTRTAGTRPPSAHTCSRCVSRTTDCCKLRATDILPHRSHKRTEAASKDELACRFPPSPPITQVTCSSSAKDCQTDTDWHISTLLSLREYSLIPKQMLVAYLSKSSRERAGLHYRDQSLHSCTRRCYCYDPTAWDDV